MGQKVEQVTREGPTYACRGFFKSCVNLLSGVK